MLTQYDFLDRFAAAADLGFRGVDIQFPYDLPADKIAAKAAAAGVEVVLHNLPQGKVDPKDPERSEMGIAALPGRSAEFRDGARRALHYSRDMGNRRVNILAGIVPQAAAPENVWRTLRDNVAFAAELFAADGLTVMVEPVNGRDRPGFALQTSEDAVRLINAVGAPNLKIQFDLYHRQIMQGDLIPGLERHLPEIAHIQFADTPGRHQPGTGEINFLSVFKAIDRLGYDGWVGAEYLPTGRLEDSLDWVRWAEA